MGASDTSVLSALVLALPWEKGSTTSLHPPNYAFPHAGASIPHPHLEPHPFLAWVPQSVTPPPPASLSFQHAHLRTLCPPVPRSVLVLPGLSQRPPGVVLAKRRTPPAVSAYGGPQWDVSSGPPSGPRVKSLKQRAS
jgi:hypothetical protein